MKKFLLLLIIVIAAGQTVSAQDKLHDMITELSKLEGIQHQVVNKEMLNSQLAQAIAADESGEMKSKIPPFMHKVDSIEILAATNVAEEVQTKLLDAVNSIKDNSSYETLLNVKQGNGMVHIITRKDTDAESTLGIYIVAMSEGNIAFVVMNGTFTQQDVEDIIKDQQKNN